MQYQNLYSEISQQCKKILGDQYYYVNNYNSGNVYSFIKKIKQISTKNIAIFSLDHWGDDEEFFISKGRRVPTSLDTFIKVATALPDRNFLVFSTVFKLDKQLKHLPNVRVIHWGDEMIINPSTFYYNTKPQLEKNFNSDKHWIGLNRSRRWFRLITGVYLLGTDLTNTGTLSLAPKIMLECNSWNGFLQFCKYNDVDDIFKISNKFDVMNHGFERLKNHDGYVDNISGSQEYLDIQSNNQNFNLVNFESSLRSMYQHTFVEIVTETVVMRSYGIMTEKFINSVYGCNFPIILCVKDTVQHLRDLGFDMFDDVVDHSYDSITNPFLRMTTAIDLNRELLLNGELAKSKWRECRDRFYNNCQAANRLYETAPAKTVDALMKVKF